MSDILISNLTDATEETLGEGTGVFDKLMQTVTLHVQNEFNEGRITGGDYATVYLGSLQTVLQQAVQFILQEQQAGKQADLIDSQIRESEEKIDLIAAQTAAQYENISASQANTIRENLLNNKQVIKLQKDAIVSERQGEKLVTEITDQTYVTTYLRPLETEKITEEIDLIQSQDLKVIAEITDQTYITTNLRPVEVEKVTEEIDLLQSQDLKITAEITDQTYVTTFLRPEELLKIQEDIDLLQSQDLKVIAETTDQTLVTTDLRPLEVAGLTAKNTEISSATTRSNNESTSKISLMAAQTLGFASDTKHKVLKLMNDGYAVALSIAGVGNVPEASQDAAIDALTQNILDEVSAPGIVNLVVETPAGDPNA